MATSSRFLGQHWTLSLEITSCYFVLSYHIKWLDQALKDVISNEDFRVLYCETTPLSILLVLSRSIESPVTYNLYDRSSHIHAFMHPYVDTFMYSHIHAYTMHMHIQHQFTHGCINRLKSVSAVSLQFGPRSFQVASSNKRTTWTLSKVSSQVCLVERFH